MMRIPIMKGQQLSHFTKYIVNATSRLEEIMRPLSSFSEHSPRKHLLETLAPRPLLGAASLLHKASTHLIDSGLLPFHSTTVLDSCHLPWQHFLLVHELRIRTLAIHLPSLLTVVVKDTYKASSSGPHLRSRRHDRLVVLVAAYRRGGAGAVPCLQQELLGRAQQSVDAA